MMQVARSRTKLSKRTSQDTYPLDYGTALGAIRDALAAVDPAPVVSCEGANTMDNAR